MTYNEENRGRFQHPARARQLILYDGLNLPEKITPTDMDLFVESRKENRMAVIEFKFKDADLPDGQKYAFTDMVNVYERAGKEAVFAVCRHDVENPNKDVLARDAVVSSFYWKRRWHTVNGPNLKCGQFLKSYFRVSEHEDNRQT